MENAPREAILAPVIVVLALATAPAIGLGITRFAYALLLPDMRADLGWSWATAGWMNTSNAIGYLVSALLAANAIAKWGASRTMLGGAIACVLSLVLCAVLKDVVLLNIARLLAGFGGGFAFVAGGVIAAGVSARDPDRSSFLLGLFYAGPGLGIAISGLVIPISLHAFGPGSWPIAWAILAVISLPLIGFLALGCRTTSSKPTLVKSSASLKKIFFLLIGYALFGAGYIAYMTFMIAWVRDGGGTVLEQTLFWTIIGAAAMTSPWLWAGVLRRCVNGQAFALLCLVTAIGGVIPLLLDGSVALYTSGWIFGCAFFAVVASTTAFVRRNFSSDDWARAISALTIFFGIGQVIGPVLIGALNDATSGLSSGLIASTILLLLGAIFGALQKDVSASLREN